MTICNQQPHTTPIRSLQHHLMPNTPATTHPRLRQRLYTTQSTNLITRITPSRHIQDRWRLQALVMLQHRATTLHMTTRLLGRTRLLGLMWATRPKRRPLITTPHPLPKGAARPPENTPTRVSNHSRATECAPRKRLVVSHQKICSICFIPIQNQRAIGSHGRHSSPRRRRKLRQSALYEPVNSAALEREVLVSRSFLPMIKY